MTPKERDAWWADMIACTVAGLLLIFVLIVHKVAFSHANQSTTKDYLPEKVRMLSLGCPACHLEKRPRSECDSQAQTWAYLECTLVEYLNANE